MSDIHSHIRANTHLFLRLPSEILKLVEIKANTIIDIGKLGSFPSNLLLGRPYYYTYELLDKQVGETQTCLRIVPPSELNAEIVTESAAPADSSDDAAMPVGVNGGGNGNVPYGFDLLAEDGTVIMKNNRLTVDDATRQALSQQEIEELKKSAGGKEIIEKILANHAGLGEKTDFAKAKYTLRKTKKYLKRFTVLPMDTAMLMDWVLAKEPARILELREEVVGLMMAWANVHCCVDEDMLRSKDGGRVGGGRWLVVDDTGGLVVAAVAERMGILYPQAGDEDEESVAAAVLSGENDTNGTDSLQMGEAPADANENSNSTSQKHSDYPIPAATNTITVLHPAVQPNLSLLKYFNYDTNVPSPTHPLHTHLKTLSWLQLLHPDEDTTYREPERATPSELQSWKSSKRGTYWKKRRRWERCRSIVDETREGGFDGLIVASSMDPASILQHAIPLLRGGGPVIIYAPTSEPLVKLVDLHSRERRAAYIQHLADGGETSCAGEDFPVDPRLLLAPSVQTSRVRTWQVLPGRTHPMMTSRGGAEGYVFTARKAVPLDGGAVARGNFNGKRRKVVAEGEM